MADEETNISIFKRGSAWLTAGRLGRRPPLTDPCQFDILQIGWHGTECNSIN
jgi:hypothetical protein